MIRLAYVLDVPPAHLLRALAGELVEIVPDVEAKGQSFVRWVQGSEPLPQSDEVRYREAATGLVGGLGPAVGRDFLREAIAWPGERRESLGCCACAATAADCRTLPRRGACGGGRRYMPGSWQPHSNICWLRLSSYGQLRHQCDLPDYRGHRGHTGSCGVAPCAHRGLRRRVTDDRTRRTWSW